MRLDTGRRFIMVGCLPGCCRPEVIFRQSEIWETWDVRSMAVEVGGGTLPDDV